MARERWYHINLDRVIRIITNRVHGKPDRTYQPGLVDDMIDARGTADASRREGTSKGQKRRGNGKLI